MTIAALAEQIERKVRQTKPALPIRNNKVIDLPLPKKAFVEQPAFEKEASGEELIIKYRIKARKLGRSILRRWHARLDIQEVDSIVDLSLCEAALRFNPTKGASFMTFLYYHLRGHLIRAVTTAASLNTVPFSSCDGVKANGESESGTLSSQGGSANAMEIAEALMSQEGMLPEETLLKKEMIKISTEACSKLDPLEREIIERLYLQEQQLLDIAHFLGYSRCHVSRVKKKALRTLQADLCKELDMESKALTDEDDSDAPLRRKVHRRRPRSKVYGKKVPKLAKAA